MILLAVVFVVLFFITWNAPASIFLMVIGTPFIILLAVIVELVKVILKD